MGQLITGTVVVYSYVSEKSFRLSGVLLLK